MKKMLIPLVTLLSLLAKAQQTPTVEKQKEWDYGLYGWVRADYIFDSRQSQNSREYQLNLYPLDRRLDSQGQDINATGASNFLSIISRLGLTFRGPEVWGAKPTGKLEGDFFGNTQDTTGLFRIRHAFAELKWPNTQLTLGQTWYPAVIPDVMPGVANFNSGIMFNPFGWAGQIKVRQSLAPNLFAEVAAYKDREFVSIAGTGASTNSSSYNSVIPTFHGKIEYRTPDVVAGLGAEYQTLQPLISNPAGTLASSEKLSSAALLGYLKYTTKALTFKAYGITGGNLSHMVMLGGYGEYAQPNGIIAYRPSRTTSGWIDLSSNGARIAPGLFAGISKNSGVDEGYSRLVIRGSNPTASRVIDEVWRVSGRVDFKQNKFRITPELEYTSAVWGDTQPDGTAGGDRFHAGNLRTLLSAVYSF